MPAFLESCGSVLSIAGGPLQIDLYGDVDEKTSKATVQSNSVEVKVAKKTPGAWPGLKAVGDAEEIKKRRADAIALKADNDAKALDDKKEKKRQNDDYVFHKQWDLEKDEKRTIERLAAEHKREAEKDLYAWADETEGRVSDKPEENLVTYFDKQLVEGGELEVKDGVVPLPGTYHAKTARSKVVAQALSEAPRSEFDLRNEKEAEKKSEDKASVVELTEEEEREDELTRREREKEEEEERFREERRVQEFEKESRAREAKEKREEEKRLADKAKENEEEERKKKALDEEAKWREEQRRKIKEYEEKKAAKAAKKEGKVDKNGESSSDEEEGEKENDEHSKENNKPVERTRLDEEKDKKKDLAEELRKGRTGISINRFECERVAAEERKIADAYFKAGFIEEAKKHESTAREAAPWVEDRRNYDTPEEAQQREAEEAAAKREAEEERARAEANSGIPAPRPTAKVELNFSKGKRSMPARERLETDEEVALREAEDLRQKKLQNPDAKGPAEDQGLWLKQRGDHFYRTRDYRAAINAYSSCVELDKKCGLAYSNRGLCHLRLMMFAECIADTTTGFDLLKRTKLEGKDEEEREQVNMQKCRCLLRRGIAHVRLGMTDNALGDVDAAAKLAPDSEELKDDLEELRRAVSESASVRLKGEGDALFKSGDAQGAIEKYTAAAEEDEGLFQVLSNRAACHLSLEDYASCVEDCTGALNIIDPSQLRTSRLCLRILVRRGTAHCWAGDFARGREDLRRALLLDVHNKQLRDDLGMLVTTTGAANSLQDFMEGALPDPKKAALDALQAAGVPTMG